MDLRSLCGHVSAQSPGTKLRQSSLDGDVAGPRARLDSPRLDSLHCECEHSRVQLQARAASAEDADASGTRRDAEGVQQLVDSAASGPALAELVLSLARGAARADEKCLFAAPLRTEAAAAKAEEATSLRVSSIRFFIDGLLMVVIMMMIMSCDVIFIFYIFNKRSYCHKYKNKNAVL